MYMKAAEDTLKTFDRQAASLVRKLPRNIAPLMDGLSFVGEPLVVLAAGLAGFISAVAGNEINQQTAFILAGIAFSVGTLLKLTLKRRRPHGLIIRDFGVISYSFPSGHAFGSMIFYGLLSIIDYKYVGPPWNTALTAFIIILIFSIGVARVYKGAHFPSDVLAGWVLGGISLALVYLYSFIRPF